MVLLKKHCINCHTWAHSTMFSMVTDRQSVEVMNSFLCMHTWGHHWWCVVDITPGFTCWIHWRSTGRYVTVCMWVGQEICLCLPVHTWETIAVFRYICYTCTLPIYVHLLYAFVEKKLDQVTFWVCSSAF